MFCVSFCLLVSSVRVWHLNIFAVFSTLFADDFMFFSVLTKPLLHNFFSKSDCRIDGLVWAQLAFFNDVAASLPETSRTDFNSVALHMVRTIGMQPAGFNLVEDDRDSRT